MSILLGSLLVFFGIEIGAMAMYFYLVRPLEKVNGKLSGMLMLETSRNLSLIAKLYEKPTITTEKTPVFRSESKKGKKSAKVQRGNAGSIH